MRECQVCGAKSWGPLTDHGRAALLKMPHHWGEDVDFSRFVECDSCEAIARKVFVETPEPDAGFFSTPLTARDLMGIAGTAGVTGVTGDDPLAIMREALSGLAGRLSEPQTRLERIACAVIRSGRYLTPNGELSAEAPAIARFACAIEREMDKST